MRYVALSRATAADRVKVLVLDYGDQQRKVAKGPHGSASIYTLNLVDKSLLRDDMTATHCDVRSVNVAGDAVP